MRIIRLKINSDVRKYLTLVNRKFTMGDRGFTEDLYALLRLKGNGLPSKDRIAKMAKKAAAKRNTVTETGVQLLIGKRKVLFGQLISLPYFHALCMMPDPMQAVERLLTTMKKLYAKTRAAECLSCSLRVNCDFGKQYGASVVRISKVVDPDFKNKAHANCPHLPEIEGFNSFVSALTKLVQMKNSAGKPEQKLVEHNTRKNSFKEFNEEEEEFGEGHGSLREDTALEEATAGSDDEDQEQDFSLPTNGEPHARGGDYDGKHGTPNFKVTEQMIDNLSALNIALLDMGNKFTTELAKHAKNKFKPSQEISVDKSAKNIDSLADIGRVVPSQHGLPDEVFDHRAEKKTLQKPNYKQPDTDKILYIIQDNSGSMAHYVGQGSENSLMLYTRAALSCLFAMAMVKRVRDDGGTTFHRFFASGSDVLHVAKTKEEYDALLDYISTASMNGGGTSVPDAIRVAVCDIKNNGGDVAKAELILISDCEDGFSEEEAKKVLNGTELNVLDVSGSDTAQGRYSASASLKKVATKYYKADESAPSIKDIVRLV